MKTRIPLVALAILALSLGCSGSQGPTGPAGPAGPAGDAGPPGNDAVTLITVPSNSAAPTTASSAAWAALVPKVTVTGVTIASPPVVKFKVTDAAGVPIAGLGNMSKSSTASVAGLTNLAFAIAKLIPGVSGGPSRWVSYIVTTVPSRPRTAAWVSRTHPAQHRQHRHLGGQRRRDLRLHVLSRHHEDQGPGRGDDRLCPEQHRRPGPT